MSYNVQHFPNYRIAYLRQIGPYGPDNYKVMGQLKVWAKQNHLLTDTTILLGISLDNPQHVSPMLCRYDACIVIDEQFELDVADGVNERTLNGGTYFVYSVKHTPEHIQQAWNDIMPLLHQQGYVIDEKPIIERYIGLMNEETYCEICVPIIE